MYMINQNFLKLADYLRQNQKLLAIQSEVSQIDGAVSCVRNEKITVAICGKSDSCFDYLFRLITDDRIEWNDLLRSVPFKLVYAHDFSLKYLTGGEIKETGNLLNISKDPCEFIEISANIPLLCDKDILFLPLVEGSEKAAFDDYLSSCDYIVICPNLSNAIGIEYNALCKLIRDEWQQPERVRAIAIDINGLSLPGSMMRALSKNLELDTVLPYEVIDDLKDFSGNQKNITALLNFEKDIKEKGKEKVIARTYLCIDAVCKKTELLLREYMSRRESAEREIEDYSDKIKAFRAQATIRIPGLGSMLDEDMKSRIFQETSEYIRFVQGQISKEIGGLSKEEMEAYVPVYYSYLISEFVRRLSNNEIIPIAQRKFDGIIDEILDCYKHFFDEDIPEALVNKTELAKENFFAFVDKTVVDKTNVGIGLLESAVLYVIIYENPVFVLFASEIVQITNMIKQGVVNIYNKYIRSAESYAKEISNRVNAVLDENLERIPKQIEEVLFPTLEKNMRQAMENFVEAAAEPLQTRAEEKQDKLADIVKKIKELQNVQNNLNGLISKCD